ncbi:MAG: AAA family ATPase [Phycisphaerales bacterium]
MSFDEYVKHGWAICPIREGDKAPRGQGWNTRGKAITTPQRAAVLTGAGLLHAFSGTMALDVDNMDLAALWLEKKGIDLYALFAAPDAVQIVSGDKSRGKLIYALPQPLPTKQIKNDDKSLMLFELRCGATTGNSAQDVLPPTVNPRTQQRYQWRLGPQADWKRLPLIPAPLHALWLSLVNPEPRSASTASTAGLEELEALLTPLDADMTYDEWIKVGMALHHETGGSEAGLALWDQWSAQGSKYQGLEDLEPHWQSFGNGPNPVTAGSLRREQVASIEDFEDVSPEQHAADGDIFSAAESARFDEQVAAWKFVTLAEIAQRPPPSWIIDDVLPREELAMLFGASGAGKSFVALDMGLAIARGIPWRDKDTRQGNVCWIAAEAEGSLRNRYHAYCKKQEIEHAQIQNFYVVGAGVNLSDRERISTLATAARQFAPTLVVVDTLAAASGGANENSGEDMGRVLDSCRLLHLETGATVLLVHHVGKDEERGARGWSGIKAAVHAELYVAKGEDGRRAVSITKMRDGEEGARFPFVLEPVNIGIDARDRPILSVVVDHLSVEPERASAGRQPRSKFAAEVLKLVRQLLPINGEPLLCQALYDEAVKRLPAPTAGGRDYRQKEARTALRALAADQFIVIRDDWIYSPEAGAEKDMEDLL